MRSWYEGRPADIEKSSDFWLTIGNWLEFRGLNPEALTAYARAWKAAPNRLEPSTDLLRALRKELNRPETIASSISRDLLKSHIDKLSQHVEALSELIPLLNRMRSPRGDKAYLCCEIASRLSRIGRYWEAEACTPSRYNIHCHQR